MDGTSIAARYISILLSCLRVEFDYISFLHRVVEELPALESLRGIIRNHGTIRSIHNTQLVIF